MMFTKTLILLALLVCPHHCYSLAQGPRSRRDFVVDSVASIASVSTIGVGAALPNLSAASDEIVAATSKQLALPPIGIGAWAWGDNIFWGYDKKVRCLKKVHIDHPQTTDGSDSSSTTAIERR
jgi:hypothetical protein